ncbi:hypothetical protein SLA2020_257010 [Shorea laevis]
MEIAEPIETSPFPEPPDLDFILTSQVLLYESVIYGCCSLLYIFLTFSCSQYFSSPSRIKELSGIQTCANEDLPITVPLESDDLLKDCAVRLESRVQQIIDEYSDVGFLTIEDLDAYVERLKEELKKVEAENAKISGSEETKGNLDLASSSIQEDQLHTANILELDSQIEKNKMILKPLQDLDVTFKRFDTIEQIEDAFTGLKVFEFNENCIKLSLKTYMPKSEHSRCQQHFENIAEPSEMDHEVQDRIILSTLRRTVAKSASKLRFSFEVNTCQELGSSFKGNFLELTLQEELANSVDTCMQHNLSSFINAVEKLPVEQMRLELESESAPNLEKQWLRCLHDLDKMHNCNIFVVKMLYRFSFCKIP